MLDIFKQYAVSLDAEVNGVWRELHGAEFLIARSDNKRFLSRISEEYTKHQEKIDAGGEEAEKLSEKIMAEVMAETVVLDWKGVAYKGKPFPYSKANVVKIFTQPEMRDFHDVLINLAADAEAYRLKEEAEQTKNS